MKNKKKFHKVQRARKIQMVTATSDAGCELATFLATNALRFFTTIYLHEVAYRIGVASERSKFIVDLNSEPENVRETFLRFAQSHMQAEEADGKDKAKRMNSFITFSRRALGYECNADSPSVEKGDGSHDHPLAVPLSYD